MSQEFWDEMSKGRNEQAYGCMDSMNAVRLRHTLNILENHPQGKLLDAGCGGGATSVEMLKRRWEVSPIDFSQGMVDEANAHLQQHGYPANGEQADITDLSRYPDEHFDAVACLGVIYYLENDEDAYREFHRILKPGGVLICSMQNELFDLFTFNRYTRRFFKRHFLPLIDGYDADPDPLDQALSGLMTNPDAPDSHDPGSARDKVTTRQDNPLTYQEKYRRCGFEPVSGPYYHGIHLAPPLIEKQIQPIEEESRRKQFDLASDWRSTFTAAQFLVEAKKQDASA